jgi:hypothetical protein
MTQLSSWGTATLMVIIAIVNFGGAGPFDSSTQGEIKRLSRCRGDNDSMDCPVFIGGCALNGPAGVAMLPDGKCGVGCQPCDTNPCEGISVINGNACSTALGCN